MTVAESDAVAAVRQVIAVWEQHVTESEDHIEELHYALHATADPVRHLMDEIRSRHTSTELDAEATELREALRSLRSETAGARRHVDEVFDRLSRELGGWREHLVALRAQLHSPTEQVDHALEQTHVTVVHAGQETATMVDRLHEHLAQRVPAASHAINGDVAGTLDSLGHRAVTEWLPMVQGAVQTVTATLDRVGHHVEQETRDAHDDSHRNSEEVARRTEANGHEHLARSHDRARATSESLRGSADTAHTLGATVIEGTESLHSASSACNSGLNAALGILHELHHLFSHLG